MSFLREFHSDLSILPLLLSPLPPPSLSPHSLSPPLPPLPLSSLLLSLSPPLSPSSPFYLSVSPPPSSPSLLPPSLPSPSLYSSFLSPPLLSLLIQYVCVQSTRHTSLERDAEKKVLCITHTKTHSHSTHTPDRRHSLLLLNLSCRIVSTLLLSSWYAMQLSKDPILLQQQF